MRHHLLFGSCVVLLLLIASACSAPGSTRVEYVKLVTPTPFPTSTPEATVPPTETPVPPPPPTLALDTTEVQRQVADVRNNTSKMRGLALKQPVPEHFMSQAELKYHMTQETLREYTAEQARQDVRRLWLLMFIDDPTMDFLQLEIEFAGSMVLGYYDPEIKELFVRTEQSTLSPQSLETLAHEYVHSLQDQHFDLKKLLSPDTDHDQAMAIRALVEGDATISGILYASKFMTMRDFYKVFEQTADLAPPRPGRAPVYLQEAWQFPYREGSEFVLTLARPGNYKPIDAAFADPPKSSEQIMHPEKYLETPRDDPKPVSLPQMAETLGAGWAFKDSDTLGEFDLQIMLLENYIKDPKASRGWGGARYDLYEHENGQDAVAVMGTVWDTPKDAAEWEDALVQSFKFKQKYDAYKQVWHDSRRTWGVKRSGDQIMFVSGTKRSAVEGVLNALP